ncbi:hypothetical protein ACTFIY_006319 [Dictyostelium cf. discoideum]
MNKMENKMEITTENMAEKIKKMNEQKIKSKYLKNTYRTLDKVSDAIYHTQIELKQYRYMVNITEEISNKLKAELETHLLNDDKIIIRVHRAIIKPKKIFKTFNWEKSMDIVEKTLHEEGLEIIKLENLGENLIIHSFNSIISPEDKDQLIHCKHITILFLTTPEPKNQREIIKLDEENSKTMELPELETKEDKRINIKSKEEILRIPPITMTYSEDSEEKRKLEQADDKEALEMIKNIFENEEENRKFEEKINQKRKETTRLASIKKQTPATPETVKRKRANSSPNPTTNYQEISTPYKTPTKITKEESDQMEAALRGHLPKVLQDVLPSVSFV